MNAIKTTLYLFWCLIVAIILAVSVVVGFCTIISWFL